MFSVILPKAGNIDSTYADVKHFSPHRSVHKFKAETRYQSTERLNLFNVGIAQ